MTKRLSADEKAAIITKEILTNGPASQRVLRKATGLTLDQFNAGWHHLKNHYAEALNKVAVYDWVTDVYGLWDNDREAFRGTMNRVMDLCTRLVTVDAGSIKALVAQGRISRRHGRLIEWMRDEMVDQRDDLAKVLVPKVSKVKVTKGP